MDYKSLYLRSFVSFFIVFVLVIFCFYLSNYFSLLFTLIYIIIFFEVFKNFSKSRITLFLLPYLVFSFVSFQFYLFYYYDPMVIFLYFFIIFTFDTSSYIGGSYFGKSKIFKIISPNKTYEGLLFGLTITFFLSIIVNYNFNIFNFRYMLSFFSITVLFAFSGDFLESFFKRKSNIKDSSTLIPGHGGFFDRFDSFIMCNYGLIFLIFFDK